MRLRLLAIPALLLVSVALGGCDDDQPAPPKSDGLLRAQDLSNLSPSDTQEGKIEDSAPSWRCTGGEDEVLRKAGWTMKSRSYATPASTGR